jgi:hypothetical protein
LLREDAPMPHSAAIARCFAFLTIAASRWPHAAMACSTTTARRATAMTSFTANRRCCSSKRGAVLLGVVDAPAR